MSILPPRHYSNDDVHDERRPLFSKTISATKGVDLFRFCSQLYTFVEEGPPHSLCRLLDSTYILYFNLSLVSLLFKAYLISFLNFPVYFKIPDLSSSDFHLKSTRLLDLGTPRRYLPIDQLRKLCSPREKLLEGTKDICANADLAEKGPRS